MDNLRHIHVKQQIIREVLRTSSPAHLEQQGLRKTPERYAILEELHRRRTDFILMREALCPYDQLKMPVSSRYGVQCPEFRQTCDLVKRTSSGKNLTQYEEIIWAQTTRPSYLRRIVAKSLSFADPRVQQIKDMMGSLLHFSVTHHAPLTCMGKCAGACDKTPNRMPHSKPGSFPDSRQKALS